MCGAGSACLIVGDLEACATRNADGTVTVSTTCPDGYGAFALATPDDTAFADLATIETKFTFTEGTCGAGTPRICVVFKDRPVCACTQFPASSGCNEPNAEGSTGDLTDPAAE